ncbi:urease accessory protein UreF, partial [Amycolatopsis sp. NPDC004368]
RSHVPDRNATRGRGQPDPLGATMIPGEWLLSGIPSACLGLPRLEAVTGELFAFCTNWVAAAIRLSLIDHTTAQAVLHEVRPVIAKTALVATDKGVPDISSSTPLLDVMAMKDEEIEVRLFAS